MTKSTNTGTLDRSTGYLVKKINGKRHKLHRLIIGAKDGEIVDHINGVKTDNRLSNLRIVTKSQNNRNRKVVGYTITKSGKFEVKVSFNNKSFYIGRYDTPADAQVAYKAVSKFAFEVTDELKDALKKLKKA